MPMKRVVRLLKDLDNSVGLDDFTLTFDKLKDVRLNIGDQVKARFKKGAWHRGEIMAINEDGTYYIKFDDEDVDERVKLEHLKRVPGKLFCFFLCS